MPGPLPQKKRNKASLQSSSAISRVTEDNRIFAPKWLKENKEATRVFKDVVERIHNLGIGSPADAGVIAQYAIQFVRFKSISEILLRKYDAAVLASSKGDKVELDLALERVYENVSSGLLTLAREIGFTPISRAKLRIDMEANNVNPLTAFAFQFDLNKGTQTATIPVTGNMKSVEPVNGNVERATDDVEEISFPEKEQQ